MTGRVFNPNPVYNSRTRDAAECDAFNPRAPRVR
jgi:hypothetical protein